MALRLVRYRDKEEAEHYGVLINNRVVSLFFVRIEIEKIGILENMVIEEKPIS